MKPNGLSNAAVKCFIPKGIRHLIDSMKATRNCNQVILKAAHIRSQVIQKWIVYLNITSDVLFVPDSEHTVPVLNVSPVT